MDRASQIVDTAEARMRKAGYHAVSFRDIADELGIKSASLHYHFPKKADLGQALVERYHHRFMVVVDAHLETAETPTSKLRTITACYRQAFVSTRTICLCIMLGAEGPGLPNNVRKKVEAFFDANISLLSEIYIEAGHSKPELSARAFLAKLQGAMILSSVSGDLLAFDAIDYECGQA